MGPGLPPSVVRVLFVLLSLFSSGSLALGHMAGLPGPPGCIGTAVQRRRRRGYPPPPGNAEIHFTPPNHHHPCRHV